MRQPRGGCAGRGSGGCHRRLVSTAAALLLLLCAPSGSGCWLAGWCSAVRCRYGCCRAAGCCVVPPLDRSFARPRATRRDNRAARSGVVARWRHHRGRSGGTPQHLAAAAAAGGGRVEGATSTGRGLAHTATAMPSTGASPADGS